jgi:polyferredoxin
MEKSRGIKKNGEIFKIFSSFFSYVFVAVSTVLLYLLVKTNNGDTRKTGKRKKFPFFHVPAPLRAAFSAFFLYFFIFFIFLRIFAPVGTVTAIPIGGPSAHFDFWSER